MMHFRWRAPEILGSVSSTGRNSGERSQRGAGSLARACLHALLAPGMLALFPALVDAAEPVKVVATLPAYASIASSVGGDRVSVASIARGDEDAHFVRAKPSFAFLLRDADLFVTTGLDLELWAPALVDKSGNSAIRAGASGYVNASQGVPLLDVPSVADRSAGDVHIYGNPHIFTSPLNAKTIAGNIAAGLERVDPAGAAVYEANLAAFTRRIDEALYGTELLEVLDAASLDPLTRQDRLVPFLEEQETGGRRLVELLGGWLGRLLPYRGTEIVAYHKNWIYFADLFGLEIVDYVEPKPGIPPSARHVHRLTRKIREEGIPVLLAANYFSRNQIETISERTGCRAVVVPLGPPDTDADAYFRLVDRWVESLATAMAQAGS